MTNKLTRRHVLKAGAALGATAFAAPRVSAQGAKTPTKVLDFMTYADVAKAEQEGQFVFYCHENEAGTAAIVEGFGKDFPKIKTSYVRAQTGALYNKILSPSVPPAASTSTCCSFPTSRPRSISRSAAATSFMPALHGRLQEGLSLGAGPAPISGPA